jgi:hypothetical protein
MEIYAVSQEILVKCAGSCEIERAYKKYTRGDIFAALEEVKNGKSVLLRTVMDIH